MAYTEFTLTELQDRFQLRVHQETIFKDIQPVQPSSRLQQSLEDARMFYLTSEKIRSEAIVFPVLLELKRRNVDKISLFSGFNLNADKDQGLIGECDFIVSASAADLIEINSPILTLIEAKKADISLGIPQCIAQMIGSRVLNEKRHHPTQRIYGCVTTAEDWQFLLLEKNHVIIDASRYYLNEIENILGILQKIVDEHFTLIG